MDHNALYHRRSGSNRRSWIWKSTAFPSRRCCTSSPRYKQLGFDADFQRVDAKQAIHVKVACTSRTLTFPAVKLHGVTISHVANEIEVSCLPGQLPEFINVDLSNIDVGHSLHEFRRRFALIHEISERTKRTSV